MRTEGAFPLVARDVLTASPQVVLLAVDKPKPPRGVESSDVTSVEPEVTHDRHGCFGPAPVTLEHDVRFPWAHHHFAGLPVGDFNVVVIDDTDVEIVIAATRSTQRRR